MALWEYKVETVKGIFWSRSRKLPEIGRICNELGEHGWELVGVSYDWFVVQYVLYFKRLKQGSTVASSKKEEKGVNP